MTHLDQMDLLISSGHSIQMKKNTTFFSSAHGTFSRINHILGHKSSLSKYKKTEIISSIFSDYTAMSVCVCTLSCVWLFVTPWTVAHQAPLSMESSRQEYWSGLPYPTSRDLPNPRIKSGSPVSPALAGRFFTTVPPGKPSLSYEISLYMQMWE